MGSSQTSCLVSPGRVTLGSYEVKPFHFLEYRQLVNRVWKPMYVYLCCHMTSTGPVGISDKIIGNFISVKEQL